MYFVHPQFKFNIISITKLFGCLVRKPNTRAQQIVETLFPNKKIVFTDMGRNAFRLIIEQLSLKDSEMLFPAYTCDIFLPVFKQYNIKPIFIDIEKSTFNIDISKIEQAITPQTKSIVVSHAYGLPANLNQILAIAQKHNLKVIEDCAHSLGTQYNGKLTGNFGDAALFSLYKLFPTLRGGMAVLPPNSQAGQLPKTKFSARDFVSLLNSFKLFSWLFKKYAGSVAEKHIRAEKLSKPTGINRVSLNIFAWQVKSLRQIIKKRQMYGLELQKELQQLGFEIQDTENNIFTFVSALVPKNTNRDELVTKLKNTGIFATRIWHTPIILNTQAQNDYQINIADFPNTVEVANRIINLPIEMDGAKLRQN